VQIVVNFQIHLLLVRGQQIVKTDGFFVSELSLVRVEDSQVFDAQVFLKALLLEVLEGHFVVDKKPGLAFQRQMES